MSSRSVGEVRDWRVWKKNRDSGEAEVLGDLVDHNVA